MGDIQKENGSEGRVVVNRLFNELIIVDFSWPDGLPSLFRYGGMVTMCSPWALW